MRIPLGFMIASVLVIIFSLVFTYWPRVEASQDFRLRYEELPLQCDDFADPFLATYFDSSKLKKEREFPNEMQLKLIGRISEGILKVAKQKGGGSWWNCGSTYNEKDAENSAMKWAYRIVYLSDKYSDDDVIINPWGIAGTAANESGFDQCALGPWPRKWGYEHKTIKRSKRSISHSFFEIKKTLLHPDGSTKWRTTGIDAAPLNELWRCKGEYCKPKYNYGFLPPIHISDVFSIGKGFEYDIVQMRKRAIINRTDRPWAYWPGRYSKKYDNKVVRWARKIGARRDEI